MLENRINSSAINQPKLSNHTHTHTHQFWNFTRYWPETTLVIARTSVSEENSDSQRLHHGRVGRINLDPLTNVSELNFVTQFLEIQQLWPAYLSQRRANRYRFERSLNYVRAEVGNGKVARTWITRPVSSMRRPVAISMRTVHLSRTSQWN